MSRAGPRGRGTRALIAAGLRAAQAFSGRNVGPVIGHLLLGLVDLAAGGDRAGLAGPTALVACTYLLLP